MVTFIERADIGHPTRSPLRMQHREMFWSPVGLSRLGLHGSDMRYGSTRTAFTSPYPPRNEAGYDRANPGCRLAPFPHPSLSRPRARIVRAFCESHTESEINEHARARPPVRSTAPQSALISLAAPFDKKQEPDRRLATARSGTGISATETDSATSSKSVAERRRRRGPAKKHLENSAENGAFVRPTDVRLAQSGWWARI